MTYDDDDDDVDTYALHEDRMERRRQAFAADGRSVDPQWGDDECYEEEDES